MPVNQLNHAGPVLLEDVIELVNDTPFFIKLSRFGVLNFLFISKHLSDRNESITRNKIFGFNY